MVVESVVRKGQCRWAMRMQWGRGSVGDENAVMGQYWLGSHSVDNLPENGFQRVLQVQ